MTVALRFPTLLIAAALAGVATVAAAEKRSAALTPLSAVALPGRLAEASGLAPASESSVYAHNDEQATIYEIDLGTGKILSEMALGRPPIADDFEALALDGNDAALITSSGALYLATLDRGSRVLRYRVIETAIGQGCEAEGLAAAGDAAFLIVCKHSGRRLRVYRWTEESGARKALDIDLGKAVPNPKKFRATDAAYDPATQKLLVLDSSIGAILEVSMDGARAQWRRLGGDHPQAEGLVLFPDGRIVIADEGVIRDGVLAPGRLTVYPPRR